MDNQFSGKDTSEIRYVPLSWNETDVPYPLHKNSSPDL
jgi:hypothetical protein